MDDLQRQLDELFIKLKWQEKHHNLDFGERIEKLENLIKTLSEDEALPYKNLIKSYQKFI